MPSLFFVVSRFQNTSGRKISLQLINTEFVTANCDSQPFVVANGDTVPEIECLIDLSVPSIFQS